MANAKHQAGVSCMGSTPALFSLVAKRHTPRETCSPKAAGVGTGACRVLSQAANIFLKKIKLTMF